MGRERHIYEAPMGRGYIGNCNPETDEETCLSRPRNLLQAREQDPRRLLS